MAEQLVDQQRDDAAVHRIGRSFMHAGELNAGTRLAVLVDIDDERGSERVDLADDRVVGDETTTDLDRVHLQR